MSSRKLLALQLFLGFTLGASFDGHAGPSNGSIGSGRAPIVTLAAQHSLLAIDGTGDTVIIDFNAPLNKVVAALLRTSSYEWPYRDFERLVAQHGRGAVKRQVVETLSAIFNPAVRAAHEEAKNDPLSPLHDLFKRTRK